LTATASSAASIRTRSEEAVRPFNTYTPDEILVDLRSCELIAQAFDGRPGGLSRDEVYAAPRSWAERAYQNLIYFNRVERGGHFAGWEQPELFASEVRTAFRSLRQEL